MNKHFDKAVTARFSRKDHLKIQTEAELKGCSMADVVRSSWRQYQQHKKLQQILISLEQRQRSEHFKMLCTVVNLSDADIKQATESLLEQGVKL